MAEIIFGVVQVTNKLGRWLEQVFRRMIWLCGMDRGFGWHLHDHYNIITTLNTISMVGIVVMLARVKTQISRTIVVVCINLHGKLSKQVYACR